MDFHPVGMEWNAVVLNDKRISGMSLLEQTQLPLTPVAVVNAERSNRHEVRQRHPPEDPYAPSRLLPGSAGVSPTDGCSEAGDTAPG